MDKYKVIAHTPVGTFKSDVLKTEDITESVGPSTETVSYQFPTKNDRTIRLSENVIKDTVFEFILVEEEDNED